MSKRPEEILAIAEELADLPTRGERIDTARERFQGEQVEDYIAALLYAELEDADA